MEYGDDDDDDVDDDVEKIVIAPLEKKSRAPTQPKPFWAVWSIELYPGKFSGCLLFEW